jgi:hypothetical protein
MDTIVLRKGLSIKRAHFPKGCRYQIIKGTKEPMRIVRMDDRFYEVKELGSGKLLLVEINVVWIDKSLVRIPKIEMKGEK